MIVGATNTAIENGYFKQAGLEVEVNYLDGSASFEIAPVLESGGVSLKDVSSKTIGFRQMIAAFQTKAADAFAMPAPSGPPVGRMAKGDGDGR